MLAVITADFMLYSNTASVYYGFQGTSPPNENGEESFTDLKATILLNCQLFP